MSEVCFFSIKTDVEFDVLIYMKYPQPSLIDTMMKVHLAYLGAKFLA